MAFIMSETPAPCNFKCEYCYVPENFEARKYIKPISADDYLRLGEHMGPETHTYWMCAIGEPFMQPWTYDCVKKLSLHHRVVLVTNLSYYGNTWPEDFCHFESTRHIGMYWSIHYNEMTKAGCLSRTMQRVERMLKAGIKIWPTLVCHQSYFGKIESIVGLCKDIGVKLILCRYRVGQKDLAVLPEEDGIRKKYADDANVDFGLWDLTPYCWEVANGICEAGVKQVIIDWNWDLCCCHGDKNKIVYGKFPEDINKIPLKPVGLCKSSKCPCKHSVMWGVNRKFPFTFARILPGWDDFMKGQHV